MSLVVAENISKDYQAGEISINRSSCPPKKVLWNIKALADRQASF